MLGQVTMHSHMSYIIYEYYMCIDLKFSTSR